MSKYDKYLKKDRRLEFGVPNLLIVKDGEILFSIDSVKLFSINDRYVKLKCADYIEEFIPGFTCNMQYSYLFEDINTGEFIESPLYRTKPLILKDVNKMFTPSEQVKTTYLFEHCRDILCE